MKPLLLILSLYIVAGCTPTRHKKQVQEGDRVILAYKIKNLKNIRLDESFLHNDFENIRQNDLFAFVAGRGEVIRGWDSVIIGCKPDSLYRFIIPWQQAYGTENIYHDIPPKSDLILIFKIFSIE